MSKSDEFSSVFGSEQATAIVRAAESHENGINSGNKGSDPFKWALLICIGYECASKESYRKYHQISAPWEQVKGWIKSHGELGSHDGDMDYLSVFCGAYNEFVGDSGEGVAA